MKWIKKEDCGNVINNYKLVIMIKNKEMTLTSIQEFSKGVYSLPDTLFPCNIKSQMRQKTKSLEKAKLRCENYMKEVAKEILK